MPMHDWTQVYAGTYHGFHTLWIGELTRLLNNGLLPDNYYAEPEQIAGQTGQDDLTLEFDPFPPGSLVRQRITADNAVIARPRPVHKLAAG